MEINKSKFKDFSNLNVTIWVVGEGEWITSALSTLNTTTEVRPLSKAPNPAA